MFRFALLMCVFVGLMLCLILTAVNNLKPLINKWTGLSHKSHGSQLSIDDKGQTHERIIYRGSNQKPLGADVVTSEAQQ